jgi:tetratricopeptide (TPR) repeat protein
MSSVFARTMRLAATLLALAHSATAGEVEDPYFGEALYYAHQELYFEALERLDAEIAQHYGVDERSFDSFYAHIDTAEFSVGDFELRYRMHLRAGRAIRAVLEGDVDEQVRNDAAYRLARIHFQKNQPQEALVVLNSMTGEIPDAIQDDVEFLRANVLMALGQPADAVPVLRELLDAGDLEAFSAYNLGIALLQDGQGKEAARQLDRAGRARISDRAGLAIRDKSNLVLGTLLFEAAEYGPAQVSLDRVRLTGPFSNQALLRAGWADATARKYDRAVVPWSLLTQRESTDPAVQEAMLALPYAYSKLDVHGRAAKLYERAVGFFGDELERVDASIASIRAGRFLEALVREEIRQDKDWVIRLRSLPESPETFYLIALMASHDFQSSLQNYLDLEDLRKKLLDWQVGIDAFEEMTRLRRSYYEPILPDIDRQFRKLDAQRRLRLEQRKSLERRLHNMLTSPAPELLATSEEGRIRLRLEALQSELDAKNVAPDDSTRIRIRRLQGVLDWTLETRYHERLTVAHEHLDELDHHVEALKQQYESFVRTRQAATHSYVGYERPLRGLHSRVQTALEQLKTLMDQQGQMLEVVATEQLMIRRQRLEEYLNQARFAFADSYDRAAKAQASREVE